MDHKQDDKKELQEKMAKDFDKLAEQDIKTDGQYNIDTDKTDIHKAKVDLDKEAKKAFADGKKEAKHPEFVPEMQDRTYPRWYFNSRGTGFLINSAAHHLDYPGYVAESPLAFGIETAPGVPVDEPTPQEKVATEVKTKE